MPPENANDYLTDEDSGDEDYVTPSNLPGSQLRSEAEVVRQDSFENPDIQWDEEDNTPLAQLLKLPKKLKSCSWVQRDLPVVETSTWREIFGPQNSATPLQIFEFFF